MAKKYKHLFDTDHVRSDLKQKSIRGGITTVGSEGLTFILRIGSMAVLARLLVPAEFGLVSMVTALTGFAQIFKDLGLSDATIQNKDIDHEKVSGLFWINSAIGLLIMLVVAASSPLIAKFYRDPRLSGIALAISSCFLFSGLTVQHQALLYRQMRFGQLALINIISTALSFLVGVVLAWKGYGYWALVIKEISLSAFLAVGTWLMSGWVPGFPRPGSGVSSLLRFGRDITGFNIVTYFSRSIDRIFIGRNWGPAVLGIYDRAMQLMLMPLNQVRFPMTQVGMSGLSALQGNPAKYRQYYSKLISILCFIYMPMVIYLGLFSRLLIRLVLGDKWIAASDIFRILALAAFIMPVSSICDLVLISRGQTKKYFFWGLINTLCIVVAIAIGVKWGSIGVASAYTIAQYVLFFPSLWNKLAGSPISVTVFFRSIFSPIIASLFMGITLVVLSPIIASLHLINAIGISFLVGVLTYTGAWFLMPGGKHLLSEYFSYFREIFKISQN